MPVVVVLFAASLHASWNALVKPATDRLALMAVMGAASFAICVPTALFVQAPARPRGRRSRSRRWCTASTTCC